MKKRILLIMIICVLIIINLFSITVYATEVQPRVVNEESKSSNVIDEDKIVSELYFNSKSISEENYYKVKSDMTLEGKIINGNAFLCASNLILKDVTINGDVFICANKLQVNSDVYLNGNVFVCASNVELDGKVARELYAICKDIVLGENYTVMYNANIMSDHISLKGTFYRDLNALVSNFEINENTKIFGSLNYSSDKEATISESAIITSINFDKRVEEKKTILDIVTIKVLDFSRYFVLTMITFIVFIKFLPNVIEKIRKNLSVSAFGIGILSLLVIPVIIFACMMLSIFFSVAFALLALFMLVLIISMSITNIAIAGVISQHRQSLKLPISVSIVTAVSWILYQIPVVGAIITFIWIATGLGISVKNCFTK